MSESISFQKDVEFTSKANQQDCLTRKGQTIMFEGEKDKGDKCKTFAGNKN